jgi:hypothetical protein
MVREVSQLQPKILNIEEVKKLIDKVKKNYKLIFFITDYCFTNNVLFLFIILSAKTTKKSSIKISKVGF